MYFRILALVTWHLDCIFVYSIQDTTIIYVDPHVLCSLFLLSFNETWLFLTSFKKYSKMKFHETPSSGYRGQFGRTDIHDEVNSRFRNFKKVPKIEILLVYIKVSCTFYLIRYTNCFTLMEK